MQSSGPLVPLVIVVTAFVLAACSSPSNDQGGNVTIRNSTTVSNVVPKDNVEELAMMVRLPHEPEEVAWDEKSGSLTAVLRFSPEDASKMSVEAAKNGPAASEKLTVESWYPAELIAQSEMSGESTIQGRSYPAATFLNPPYTKGTITRIDNTDYFILRISP
jgi:hypothetical protein